jgi:adenosine kinase
VTCPAEDRKTDPTGVGDAFRAGFLAGVAWELPLQRCAQIGSLIATYVIETVGTQEYEFGKDAFLKRIAGTYGDDASADIEPHLRCHRP